MRDNFVSCVPYYKPHAAPLFAEQSLALFTIKGGTIYFVIHRILSWLRIVHLYTCVLCEGMAFILLYLHYILYL